MTQTIRKRENSAKGPRGALVVLVMAVVATSSMAQSTVFLEDFEFASSDEAAADGVIDITDPENQPTFYISGADENASPAEPGGLYSIGTDAVFCLEFSLPCVPGTFIGFRLPVNPDRFPAPCPGGGHFAPLQSTYGDPAHPGAQPPDYPLSDLTVLWDVYGDGGFADGLTGAHLWLRLIDCEGEKFEFINYSEVSLYSEIWTFDVRQGRGQTRLSADSLTEVPDGDRLLTEIAAIEVVIQDTDDPPTALGRWYVDYLRFAEPAAPLPFDFDGDGDVDLGDYAAMADCLRGPGVVSEGQCVALDGDLDGDVDLADFSVFERHFGGGQ